MRFCEYIQQYRIRNDLTYISMARKAGITVYSVRLHCHGYAFPHYQTFSEYFKTGTLDFENLRDAIKPVEAESLYDIYEFFRNEERAVKEGYKLDSDVRV